jgi:hypothetical protein
VALRLSSGSPRASSWGGGRRRARRRRRGDSAIRRRAQPVMPSGWAGLAWRPRSTFACC